MEKGGKGFDNDRALARGGPVIRASTLRRAQKQELGGTYLTHAVIQNGRKHRAGAPRGGDIRADSW